MIADADRKLREIAQLWSLAQKLPHLPTPAEQRLLAEFAEFAAGSRKTCSCDAALAGFRSLWREHRFREIVEIGRQLDDGGDRDLRSFTFNAEKILQARG